MSFAALLLLTATATSPATSAMPADLAAYVEEIRAAGMTGEAKSSLLTVSTAISGENTITFPKDAASGQYGNHYRSNGVYHKPSADELARMRQVAADRERLITPRLRALADRDGSGFVSTREGSEFRRMFEFGLKAAFILSVENPGLERLCTLLNVTPSEASVLAAEYERVRSDLADVATVPIPSLRLPLPE